ncbi:MAG: hypothetical protein KDA27_22660 [Candidatus Eisenbacteria bacterium]|uniref:Uncharacterized protein n=1 Tax=Eiseniibacteriota bacterium TaxID=2212470 RepID=A0A956SFS8_UNCEI|nr:hypothetical protein [Candidatus Eisenbacteria bacterium]
MSMSIGRPTIQSWMTAACAVAGVLATGSSGCAATSQTAGIGSSSGPPHASINDARATVVEPVFLELAGPIADPQAEISGLTWKDDMLIILPQFPDRFAEAGELGFFTLTRDEILAAIDGEHTGPITPRRVTCHAPGLSRIVRGFDGLEAIGLIGDRCYLSIEADEDTVMAGYLASGRYDSQNEAIVMDLERLTAIPLGLNIPNLAEETMLIVNGEILTIGEANGANVNPHPVAKRFDAELEYLGTVPLPQIEYRVTDATRVDEDGRFWVINYLWPGDRKILKPADDPEPPLDPNAKPDPDQCVERLLELRLVRKDVGSQATSDVGGEVRHAVGGGVGQWARIERTDTPPIYLTLQPDGVCRNWEAIAELEGRGFLVMTDKYPTTLLAFVPYDF